MMKNNKLAFLISAVLATGLAACSGDDGKDGATGAAGSQGAQGSQGEQGVQGEAGQNGVANLVSRADVVKTNANIAYAAYSDSLITAQQLTEAVNVLVAEPTEANLALAKQAWLAAREPYGQTEVYRFRNGPIETVGGEGVEGRVNAWPLGEAIIDYVAPAVDGSANQEDGTAAVDGSIITNTTDFPTINAETLKTMFEHDEDERNVTTGYHAIEFLLWGQDLNLDGTTGEGGNRDATAGQRPATDYATNGACTSGDVAANDEICTRRGQYLIAASELLAEDLALVVDQWEPLVGAHYQSFTAGGDASLALILEGMGRLSWGELAGERINVALRFNSQEDEHSCFSDNTHRDIYLNAKGVQNSFAGSYTRVNGEVVDGAGFDDLLVKEGFAERANDLRAALEQTQAAATVLDTKAQTGMPFDALVQQSIRQENVLAVIGGLQAQTEIMELVFDDLSINSADLRQDTEEF